MNRYLTLAAFLFVTVFVACNKKSVDTQLVPATASGRTSANQNQVHNAARYSGSNYSQPISMELANTLIGSYRNSVGDSSNALRSITLNADTLRNLLQDSNLVTLKFIMAHQPAFTATSFGKYSGMNASELAMILVGYNEYGNNLKLPIINLPGTNNSQSISLGLANNMIQSYLTSVHYPYADTALRSLSFDADTLRSYIKDTRIVKMQFVLAHQVSYSQNNYGKYAAMDPFGLTLVIIGLDSSNQIVMNSSNGVDEHWGNCPGSSACESLSIDALLH